MNPDNIEILYTPEMIASRISELGCRISNDYRGKDLTVVTLMTGGMIFAADLVRKIDIPIWIDSINVSSYRGHSTSGKLEFRSTLKMDVRGRHVILADEVFDTGLTLNALRGYMLERGAASVKAAVAVVKDVRRPAEIAEPEYVGFYAPDRYLIGYGLDSDEDGRNYPFIGVV